MIFGLSRVFSQTREGEMHYYPLLQWNTRIWEDQSTGSVGGGLIAQGGIDDSLQLVALFSRVTFDSPSGGDQSDPCYTVDSLMVRQKGKHRFISLLKSYADRPVIGGIGTFSFISGYGYNVLNGDHSSLWIGGSLAVSDWGDVLGNGSQAYLLPLPFIHYDLKTRLMEASADFTTSPLFDLTLAPESRFHINGSAILTDMGNLWDGGMKYDLSAEYRFFDENHPLGDFAGIKAGFQAEDTEYVIQSRDGETLNYSWKALYGTLDLSLLEITGGYLLDGREQGGDGYENHLGQGFFCHIQLAYAF